MFTKVDKATIFCEKKTTQGRRYFHQSTSKPWSLNGLRRPTKKIFLFLSMMRLILSQRSDKRNFCYILRGIVCST